MRTDPPARAWTPQGQHHAVPGEINRIPAYDPRSGDHLWILPVAYRVDPAKWYDRTAIPILDGENILFASGTPGCYYCEQLYTPLLATRRCKGEPTP